MRIVTEAADGYGVIEVVEATPLDVVLLDVGMPGPGFLEVLRKLRSRRPDLPVLG